MWNVATIGLDLAKDLFQVHGADADGASLFNRKLRRSQLLGFFVRLPPQEKRASWPTWQRREPVKKPTTGGYLLGDKFSLLVEVV